MTNMKQQTLNLPYAPVIVSRVPVFAATHSSPFNWERATAWGKVRVSGKLDQSHRDVLDAIMASVQKTKVSEDTGAMLLLVDLYDVRKKLGAKSTNNEFITDKIKDMMSCIVEIFDENTRIDKTNRTATHMAGIISDLKESNVKVPANSRTGSAFGNDERSLWIIVLSGAWMRLMEEGLVYQYAEHLQTIRAMRRDVSKAVTRFMLSHQEGAKFSLDAIFESISTGASNATVRQWKTRIADDLELMAQCGIKIGNGYATRTSDKGCYIYNFSRAD